MAEITLNPTPPLGSAVVGRAGSQVWRRALILPSGGRCAARLEQSQVTSRRSSQSEKQGDSQGRALRGASLSIPGWFGGYCSNWLFLLFSLSVVKSGAIAVLVRPRLRMRSGVARRTLRRVPGQAMGLRPRALTGNGGLDGKKG